MSMEVNSCIRTVKCFMFVVGVCEYGGKQLYQDCVCCRYVCEYKGK